MSGTTTRGGHIGVSDAGLRPHLRPGRRAIRRRRLTKGGTFWAGSSTSTKLRHEFPYSTPSGWATAWGRVFGRGQLEESVSECRAIRILRTSATRTTRETAEVTATRSRAPAGRPHRPPTDTDSSRPT